MKTFFIKHRNKGLIALHITATTTIFSTLYYMIKNKIDNPDFQQNRVKKEELVKIEELKQGKRVCVVGAGPSGIFF